MSPNKTKLASLICITLLCFGLTGCSTLEYVPKYSVSASNIQTIQQNDVALSVDTFESAPLSKENCNPISIRGLNLHSPYEESFAKYVEEALKLELSLAEKYDPASDTKIKGLLLKNDLSTAGHGIVEMQFQVFKHGRLRYEKTFTATSRWRKAFAGYTAFSLALRQYSPLVNNLLEKLLNDKKFIAAITKEE